MKAAAYLLGVLLIVVAIVYFAVPADSLPSFFPGHEPGMTRVRLKHGIASGVVGVVLLVVAGSSEGADLIGAPSGLKRRIGCNHCLTFSVLRG
jgi:hypothetical protein